MTRTGTLRRVAVSLAVIYCGLLLTVSLPGLSFVSARGAGGGAAPVADAAQTQAPGCISCSEAQDENKPHWLAGSYYDVGDGLTATLMLNNKGPKTIEVTPTFFSLSGHRMDLPPVTVEGNSFREIDMREFGLADTPFRSGSLQLFHRGKDLVLGAQVKLVDADRSLIFEEKLLEIQTEIGQQRLEGVWWLPSPRGDVSLVLSNTSDGPLEVRAVVDGSAPPQRDSFTTTLGPHETRIVDVKREVVGKRGGTFRATGGVRLEHEGGPGALLARVLMQDASSGYSVSARFFDPQKAKSNKLQGAGLRLNKLAGERLTPVVVARNVSGSPTVVSGRIPYRKADGGTETLTLPALRLAPGETGTVDFKAALRQLHGEVSAAGIEFEYTGDPGGVIMLAQSVNPSGDHAFVVPMWDIMAQRSSTGGYPWRFEDNTETMVYLKNVSDKKQDYVLEVKFPGADYSYITGIKPLDAGQSLTIDIRKWRDEQVPDANGRTIPLNATRGQVQWSVRSIDNLPMIGRSEQVDLANRTSFSYACQGCCPNEYIAYGMSPDSASVFAVSQTSQFSPLEVPSGCYGPWNPYPVGANSWSVDDTSVAHMVSDGVAEGTAGGVATVYAEWHGIRVIQDSGTTCMQYSEMNNASAPVEVACATPTNFRQVGNGTDVGGGTLRFNYAWDSSTGNLAHLSQCTVGEIVDYPGNGPTFVWPSPPFGQDDGSPDPTVINLAATAGEFQDNHRLDSPNWVTPYQASTFTATQHYRYRCQCHNNNNYVNVMGPLNIVRSVTQNSGTPVTWRFTVTKSGASATINPLP